MFKYCTNSMIPHRWTIIFHLPFFPKHISIQLDPSNMTFSSIVLNKIYSEDFF